MTTARLDKLFDTRSSSKDAQRLSPHLTGWMRLAGVLTTLNEPDLRRLIVMELSGKRRAKILDRLAARLCEVIRTKNWEGLNRRIARCTT